MTINATRRRTSGSKPAKAGTARPVRSFALDDFMPYRLAILSEDVSRSLAEVYGRRFGLNIAEWRVLANLAHWGAMPAGELAARSNLDKPKITRTIQRLVARGYVTRTVSEADRRAVEVTLTSSGFTAHAATATLALEWETEFLSVLSDNAQRNFTRALATLHDQVRQSRSATAGRVSRGRRSPSSRATA